MATAPSMARTTRPAQPGYHVVGPTGDVVIPPGIADLEAFRAWVFSPDYPNRGDIAWLDGTLWVDLSMEELFTHVMLKTRITVALGSLVEELQSGYLFADGALVTNPAAGLSNEPDASFVSFAALRAGRVKLEPNEKGNYLEVTGSPDMVLEVVSKTSVPKDTVRLRDLYWRAGVREYWLVDGRGDDLSFELLKRGRSGFTTTREQGGYLKSAVFGRSFRLVKSTDPLGHPRVTLEVAG